MTDDLSLRATLPRAVELRSIPFRDVELRGATSGLLTFTGYACVTEAPYEVDDWLGSYTEVVRQGSFGKTLAENADVPFKLNHGGITLARTKSGTMKLAEDSTGLHVEAGLDPANPDVQRVRSAMERGDLDEMSFAFQVTRQSWSADYAQRDITEVNLNKGDVSVVNYAANPATAGATLRAAELFSRVDKLNESERRELFDRLHAEFNPPTRGFPLALALTQYQL